MMKKNFILVAIVLLSIISAKAQENGKYSLEIQATPNITGGPFFSVNDLRVRYSLNNGDNIRVGLAFNINTDNGRASLTIPVRSNSTSISAYNEAMETYNRRLKDYDITRIGYWGIGFGYEHFLGENEKFRPYLGGQVGIRNDFSYEHKMENYLAYDNSPVNEYECYDETIVKGGQFSFSAGAFAGFDYYITENIYLGAELTVDLTWTHERNGKRRFITNNPNVSTTDATYETNGRNLTGVINYGVAPLIRLGWRF